MLCYESSPWCPPLSRTRALLTPISRVFGSMLDCCEMKQGIDFKVCKLSHESAEQTLASAGSRENPARQGLDPSRRARRAHETSIALRAWPFRLSRPAGTRRR